MARKPLPRHSLGRPSEGAKIPAPVDSSEIVGTHEAGELTDQLMPGVIRDERGVWIAPETED